MLMLCVLVAYWVLEEGGGVVRVGRLVWLCSSKLEGSTPCLSCTDNFTPVNKYEFS
jgi:hypothetical protein